LATRRKRATRAPRPSARAVRNPWLDVGADGKSLHIGHFLTFIVIRLANALKANVTRRYLADFRLSVPEWRLLAMTVRFEPVRFSALVAKSGMDKGQASRTLQMLTRRGLVASRASARGSRRGSDAAAPVILTVTAKGQKLYRTVLPVAQRNQARLLRLMTRDERRILHGIVKKLFAATGHPDLLA